MTLQMPDDPLLEGLQPATWSRANRELLAKIITELTFEEVLSPDPLPTPPAQPGEANEGGGEQPTGDHRGGPVGGAEDVRRRLQGEALQPAGGGHRSATGPAGPPDTTAAPTPPRRHPDTTANEAVAPETTAHPPARRHPDTPANDPTAPATSTFRLRIDDRTEIRYEAKRRILGHWRVAPESIQWIRDDRPQPLPDVADVIAQVAPALGVDPSTTAGGLCELANTVVSDAWQLQRGRPSAELVEMVERGDGLRVEGEMRGHPWIVANKGRLGFDAADLARYTPEAQRRVRLLWLAAAPGRADTRAVTGLDHATVVREQVGDEVWAELRAAAARAGLDPDAAAYVPVHPWQWRHRIVPLHAAELARGELVPLGEAPAAYLPQQSIRTLVDVDHPERRYLKLPVSILNTSVYRGLPRDRALAAPALSEWFTGLVGADPFLDEVGLTLLGEVASVSVAHRAFEAVPDVPYQHTEMLGAIWRESVEGHLRPGERAVTLAALLHRDPQGTPFVDPLIRRSGLGVGAWVDALHRATLPPLVHVLYRFGATFSPHAQNCLLVLRDGAPARLAVKDFVDDAMVSADPLPELGTLPPDVRRALGDGLEAALLVQWIQGGLLVCVHRYLSELLEDHLGYPEAAFWASAERALRDYQDRFAGELADRFDLFDLDAPAFVKLCLNRVRLFERGYADDPERPVAAAVGWIDNPLALPDPDDPDDADPDDPDPDDAEPVEDAALDGGLDPADPAPPAKEAAWMP